MRNDGVDELLVEIGDIHQLGPRPLQRGSELGKEVLHSGLAASDAVHEERAHETPAQTGAETDCIVDLLSGGDAIVDEPQGLSPHRFEQAIGDESIDLFGEHQRTHTNGRVHLGGALFGSGRCCVAATDLDQWKQVHRVKRMTHHETLGVGHAGLNLGGQDARCR